MTTTNQNGDPVEEYLLFTSWGETATTEETHQAIALLAELLGIEFYRTNATKHGNVEVVLRKVKATP